eukprot:CAMPEP_0183307270 /NCGR_PEP_ID=MMETSP0160_2-20130417/17233_1 /TAXON_ID=2839 ORGANISM="Odontella Sinensis, Strain Grunow 1884" /NCGR_SAMPLE_ID=MMETSP0160_2 /ASSEMBLY_ACC=CAM_ASM_000250 /LENGTH=162 /DNA_ID=CAMNT_0025470823 /DNA_START=181 /DNA_END=669 /DNA_ORIENTATION=-
MAPVVRSSDVKASPSTIWSSCFSDMKWEKWDPDVTEMIDVEGGLTEGGTFQFVMKEGPVKTCPCRLSNVVKDKSLTFSGSAMGGMLTFEGTFELVPKEGGEEDTATTTTATTTTVNYTFGMEGCLGSLVSMANPKAIVEGTEAGLANVVRISEEGQKKADEE